MEILEMWRNEMYRGAVAMWPTLTPEQFGEAGRAWLSRQRGGLTVQQVAAGVEQELRTRYGNPSKEAT